MSGRYRKMPVEVDAVFFDGWNYAEVQAFTGRGNFWPLDPDNHHDGPGVIAEVWDDLHDTWVGVKARMWIIRGLKGEYYPCEEEVFAASYEAA